MLTRFTKKVVPDRRSISTLLEFVSSTPFILPSTLALGTVLYANNNYKVSDPNQYLVRTGIGIKDIRISKTGFRFPFQRSYFVDMNPKNYSFHINAMTNQKLEFNMPGVFTIGPKNDPESITKYSRLIFSSNYSDSGTESDHLSSLIIGVVEGETRVLAAQMTFEEIFNDRTSFKNTIINNVQKELEAFGLSIYNANIKELADTQGSEYFSFAKQKARSEVEGKSKVDIAEAKKISDIGAKSRETDTRMQLAEYELQAVEKENEIAKRIAESTASLAVVKAESARLTNIANIESQKASQIREMNLQKDLEVSNLQTQLEALRAKDYSRASIDADIKTKNAEAEANAIKVIAEANFYKAQKGADAQYAVLKAQADGLEQLKVSCGNNVDDVMKYLMVDRGILQELANSSAHAIQGLKPNMTIWSGTPEEPIRNLLSAIPQLLNGIETQTGINFTNKLKALCDPKDLIKN